MNSLLNALNLNRSSAAEAYGLNSKKTETGKTESSTESSSSAKEPPKVDTKPSDEIALSPRALRAQKIQAMSKDFFADGKFSVAEIPALVSRLQKDGILSDAQVERLSQNGISLPSQSTNKQSLQDFIDDELKSLAEKSPNSPMINTLIDAKNVLKNMDDAQSPVLAQKATKVFGQLTDYLNSNPTMSDSQKQLWQGLKSTMQVASSMGMQQSALGQLSSYLALAKR
ncbi:hypothetical protein K5M76_13215 [Shewanella xiamenensis]|uniref:hypothetical protein n=1 Tax=Shewanella TaxID=22 RepID=UPI001CC54DE2|nr:MULTISPECIES: hypothetical protein [Shewanella]MCT8859389.1 hypothetical protein [Shewanella xiamenensis]MDN5500471.1 hypothetical protein [Shewanella sp.]MDN5528210.1 hypothetical protein [Shewanella sp.]UWG63212.1 hypothetical protein K5M76_13215 [Shewanella xiamenensis]BDA60235.1 hypothetical protein NUITMVS1_16980 [Shewanella xiamenensis]